MQTSVWRKTCHDKLNFRIKIIFIIDFILKLVTFLIKNTDENEQNINKDIEILQVRKTKENLVTVNA